MKEIVDIIKNRRSVRKYKEGVEISDEDVKVMLEAAMMAPSACNKRPWEFVVVRDLGVREELLKAHPNAKMIVQASLAIVVCGLPQKQEGICEGFWPQDCGAAIENLLLQATAMGYGTVWCGVYPREERAKAFQEVLGVSSVPVAVIAVGEVDEEPAARGYYEEEKVKFL